MSRFGEGASAYVGSGRFVNENWFVFPACWPTWFDGQPRCGCGRGHTGNNIGKAPLTPHGLKDASQTLLGVREFEKQFPEANIGGYYRKQFILDVDKRHQGFESLAKLEAQYMQLPQTRVHATGGGGLHYLYRLPDGRELHKARLGDNFPGLDIKADGGYIVLPGSRHASGGVYSVMDEAPIALAPNWLLELCDSKQTRIDVQPTTQDCQPGWVSQLLQGVTEGRRNDSAYRLAVYFANTNPRDITRAVLSAWNQLNTPPLPDSELEGVIESAYVFITSNPTATNTGVYIKSPYIYPQSSPPASERDKSVTDSVTKPGFGGEGVTEQIQAWVATTSGWFSYEECDKELGFRDSAAKATRRQVFKRLRDGGKIESHPHNNRLYRYVNVAVRTIDFKAATRRTPLDLRFPFGIENLVNTYPGNIIVLAGAADSGKTAFLLNFIRLNMDNFSIYYQSSEMGSAELANRLAGFSDLELEDWNFQAEERSRDFADVIRPDCINIIDYLELSDDCWRVAEYLCQIHDKLAGGIALVALQKKRGAELGRGGDFGLEKPRLYLSMDNGKIAIQKAKNWASPECNPNGLSIRFKVLRGCEFIETSTWEKEVK